MRWAAWSRLFVGVGLWAGCQADLGECDMERAERIVLSQNGLVATEGQALAHDSCGNGAFCHSSGAHGRDRHGVPAGMDFDMLPVDSGWRTLYELRDESWAQVRDGHMPPGGERGSQGQGDSGWVYAPVSDKVVHLERREDAEPLAPIDSDEGRDVLRNWLACTMPTVADDETGVTLASPPAADAGSGADQTALDWADIHPVLDSYCALGGCHTAAAAAGAGSLSLEDPCEALRELRESDGPCGTPRASAGDDDSVLLRVMAGESACDGRVRAMPPPPANPLDEARLQLVRRWIQEGMASSACAP